MSTAFERQNERADDAASDGVARFLDEDGELLCTLIRASVAPAATRFFTPATALLQVGCVVHPAGHEIPRHRHTASPRTIDSTHEVLVVRSGRCIVDLFSRTGAPLAQVELRSGDVMVLSGAGHGLRMMEDTVLLEVKQGPYQGEAEKEIF